MAVSYTKDQRVYARENNMHLCTIAARGIEHQGPSSEIKSRLIEDCALHAMCIRDDAPFERIDKLNLPSDVSDAMECIKLSIVRHSALGFEDIERHEWLLVLNALRHFVLMLKSSEQT